MYLVIGSVVHGLNRTLVVVLAPTHFGASTSISQFVQKHESRRNRCGTQFIRQNALSKGQSMHPESGPSSVSRSHFGQGSDDVHMGSKSILMHTTKRCYTEGNIWGDHDISTQMKSSPKESQQLLVLQKYLRTLEHRHRILTIVDVVRHYAFFLDPL